MTDPDDPRLRLRCFIGGKLVDETWLDASNPDSDAIFRRTLRRHMQLVEAANLVGEVWMVENYDPSKPDNEAYERVGTDANGMVDPRPIRRDEP